VHPLLALALLAVAGLAATRVHWPRLEPRLRRDAALAPGLPLVLIGLVLGPGISLLDQAAVHTLTPVTALAVGCLGAALGARLEWRLVKRVPRGVWILCGVQALAILAAVGASAWAVTRAVPALRAAWTPILPAGLTLGAVAVVSGPAAVARAAQATGARRPMVRAFDLAATLDAIFGVLAFAVIVGVSRPRDPAAGVALGRAAWLAMTLGSGVLVGMAFLSVTRLRPVADELSFALLGAVLFGAGAAYAAGSSPLLVCAIAAALIVNLAPQRRGVGARLASWEHPATTGLFIMMGALLVLPTPWILPAALGLATLRVTVRWAVVRYGRSPLEAVRLPAQLGLATTAQGGTALAIAMSFFLIYPGAGALVTTVVVGVLVAQLAAAPLLARSLGVPTLTAPQPAAELS